MKRNQLILEIVTALYWFSLYTYVPYFSPYVSALGATATLAGMAVGSYGFAQMILRIPVGITADILHRQKIFITLGVALSGLAALGMRLFANPYAMLLFRLISGMAAAMWVCYTTLYTSYYAAGETTKALGTINAVNNAGKFAASVLGGIVAQRFGITAPFVLSFGAAALAVVLSFFVEDIKIDRKPLRLRDVILVGKEKTLLYSCILCALLQMIIQATAFSFTSNLAKEKGADDLALGLIATLFTLGMLVTSFFAGRSAIAKLGEKRALLAGFGVLAVCCGCIPFAPSVSWIYVLQFLGGAGNGLLFSLLMAMAVKRIEQAKRSTAMGFFQAIYGIGMTVGPPVMGFLVDKGGFTLGFLFMGGVAFIGFLGLLLFYRRFAGEEAVR